MPLIALRCGHLSVPPALGATGGRRIGSLAERADVQRYVGALDQGTTSTRFMVFDGAGREVARRQIEHSQILPAPGWVEHAPIEILAPPARASCARNRNPAKQTIGGATWQTAGHRNGGRGKRR